MKVKYPGQTSIPLAGVGVGITDDHDRKEAYREAASPKSVARQEAISAAISAARRERCTCKARKLSPGPHHAPKCARWVSFIAPPQSAAPVTPPRGEA